MKYVAPNYPKDNNELIDVFPEGKQISLDKISEFNNSRKEIISAAREFIEAVNSIAVGSNKDEFFIWFWTEAYIKYFITPDIIWIDKQLFRLKRLKRSFTPVLSTRKNQQKEDWEELKRRAKDTPINTIAESYLERVRHQPNRVTALCPFRTEKTPSFTLDLTHNRFKCFGCNASGDAIDFVMKIEQIPFADAVRRLAI